MLGAFSGTVGRELHPASMNLLAVSGAEWAKDGEDKTATSCPNTSERIRGSTLVKARQSDWHDGY